MNLLHHRNLDHTELSDIEALKELYRNTPDYFRIVYGKSPDPNEAEETFTSLPPGYTLEQKTVLGFFLRNTLVGVADLLNGYPEPGILWIGLLLFSETHQGKGYGRSALEVINSFAAQHNSTAIRLAVIATNTSAHHFWLQSGFIELYRKTIPDVTGEVIVMERLIQTTYGEDQ